MESSEYPHFARRLRDAADAVTDQRFEFGLGCVLDEIAARVRNRDRAARSRRCDQRDRGVVRRTRIMAWTTLVRARCGRRQ
ncbi:hypothetical protein [Nocardia sp. NPDC052112]|uniref:hypothetical protein n=1 Tax=Nocardia sp. NPDC052112 TaxID=3155646 RepID=UPI003437A56B